MHWQPIASLVLFAISTLNLVYVALMTYRLGSTDTGETYTYRGHDFPETLPLLTLGQLPLVSMVAEESIQYPILGHSSDPEWFSLTTSEFGYVRLGPDGRLFIVSMFHQMHCLRVLNLAFSKARIATPGHIKHCLNYLRQAALCAADLTLEPGDFETKDYGVERTGATYTCRDWSSVYPIMEEYSARWYSSGNHSH